MPRSHAKMHLRSVPQKLNFVMGKTKLKSYTLEGAARKTQIFHFLRAVIS